MVKLGALVAGDAELGEAGVDGLIGRGDLVEEGFVVCGFELGLAWVVVGEGEQVFVELAAFFEELAEAFFGGGAGGVWIGHSNLFISKK